MTTRHDACRIRIADLDGLAARSTHRMGQRQRNRHAAAARLACAGGCCLLSLFPKHIDISRASRRQFLGRGAAAAAAIALGPAILSACGSGNGPGGATTISGAVDDGSPASGLLRVSNWPLYIADGFVAAFQKAAAVTVDYKEDYNDDEGWFAKNKEPLSRKQDIGCDLVIPFETIAARLITLGWLAEIRESRWPNKKNLQPAILNSSIDPGRKFTAPYMFGMVGLAYRW